MTLQAKAEIDKLTSECESNKKDNEKRMTELQEELSKTQKEQTRMEETSKVEGATAVEKVRAKMNAKVENLNLGHCIWRSLGILGSRHRLRHSGHKFWHRPQFRRRLGHWIWRGLGL